MPSRRLLSHVVFIGLPLVGVLLAHKAPQQPSVVFHGLDMELVKTTDAMTDATGCLLSIGSSFLGGWQFVLTDAEGFFIMRTSRGGGYFTPGEQHLIRVGTQKAVPLIVVPKRNVLTLANPSVAAEVVKAVVAGDGVKLRFFSFPSGMVNDSVFNPNVGYVYQRAIADCGWRDIGVPDRLAPVALSVFQPTGGGCAGYTSISVIGNSDLGITDAGDECGGGCYITVRIDDMFGLERDEWRVPELWLFGESLVVRDSAGAVTYSGREPLSAAKAAWLAAPLGTLDVDPPDGDIPRTTLYGFREL